MNNVIQAHHVLGMTRNPFPPTPDAHGYFYTEGLNRDFAETLHCIRSRKGFLLLTGEVGLGKSTFVRNLMETLKADDTAVALVLNTFLQGSALLEAINDDFGLKPTLIKSSIDDPPANMVVQLARLNAYLLRCGQTSKNCVLIIDDAQNLNTASLELVRLLCNLETMQEKLLQIVLVGQPELLDTLSAPSLRQLKSRIVKHVRLVGLSVVDTARYVERRLANAGEVDAMVPIAVVPAAIEALFVATAGNPRQMNLILDRCLYGLVATRSQTVTRELMRTAITETRLDVYADQSANLPCASSGTTNDLPPRRRFVFRNGSMALTAAMLLPTLALAGWSAWRDVSMHQHLQTLATPVVAEAQRSAPQTKALSPERLRSLPVQVVLAAPNNTAATNTRRIQCTARTAAESLSTQPRSPGEMVMRSLTPGAINRYGSWLEARGAACLIPQESATFLIWRQTALSAQLIGKAEKSAVQTMQLKLRDLGLLAVDQADGWLGPLTRAAIKQFQTHYDLPSTGETDALTILLLENSNANHTVVARAA